MTLLYLKTLVNNHYELFFHSLVSYKAHNLKAKHHNLSLYLFQDTDPGHVTPHVSLSHVEFLELISLVMSPE